MNTLEEIGVAAINWREKCRKKNKAKVARRKALDDFSGGDGIYYDLAAGDEDDAVEAAFKLIKEAQKECKSARGALDRKINKHLKEAV